MGYEIVKSISHRKKDNKIFITSASNNVWPKTYSRWEFMPDKSYSKEDTRNRELHLFRGIIGGSYQLSGSVNENWKYAENKFYEYCKNNNISTSYIWELPYNNDGNIELIKPYYEIFKRFLEEKKEGKYYLSSSLGCIIKVNKNSFNYTPYFGADERYCKSYKQIYNDYCNISEHNREIYNIEIKEYNLEKNKENIIENTKKEMELAI